MQKSILEEMFGRKPRILFEKTHPNAVLPSKTYPQDVGWDLYAVEDVTIPAKSQNVVNIGLSWLILIRAIGLKLNLVQDWHLIIILSPLRVLSTTLIVEWLELNYSILGLLITMSKQVIALPKWSFIWKILTSMSNGVMLSKPNVEAVDLVQREINHGCQQLMV